MKLLRKNSSEFRDLKEKNKEKLEKVEKPINCENKVNELGWEERRIYVFFKDWLQECLQSSRGTRIL